MELLQSCTTIKLLFVFLSFLDNKVVQVNFPHGNFFPMEDKNLYIQPS